MINPRRVAAAYLNKQAMAVAKLPPAIKQKANADLRYKGFDGKQLFQRSGQIVSVAFDILKKYGITLSNPLTPGDFARDMGTLRIDIEFINEADPFSPTPIGDSLLFLQYTKLETGRYEVIGYLS